MRRHAAAIRHTRATGCPPNLERLRWPRSVIDAEQTRALRQLLRYAVDHSRWHAERLRNVGVDQITPAEIRTIPPMTKHDVMEHWDAIVTDPNVTLAEAEAHLTSVTADAYFRDEYHVIASGGSSGRRGVFVYDWHGWAVSYLGTARGLVATMHRMQVDPNGVFATVSADLATHATAAIAQTFADVTRPIVRAPATLPVSEVVSILNQAQPLVLHAYPSMLPALCEEARHGRLRIAPTLIWSTSEPLMPDVRLAAETMWRCAVLNGWAASESIGGAFSCGSGAGFHIGEDLNIIELVDEAGHPAARGERAAKILMTNLYNRILPLIRYEISDEFQIAADPCACGSAYLKARDLVGRHDEIFEYRGGIKVHPIHFASVLGRQPAVLDYQVTQTEQGVKVDLIGPGIEDVDAIASALQSRLVEAHLAQPEVIVRRVDSLPRQAAAMVIRFVPRPISKTSTH